MIPRGISTSSPYLSTQLGIERNSYFFCTHERPADVPVLGTGVERDQSIAMLAVRLKAVPKILRPLAKDHRALRAFDFDFFVDHGMLPKANRHSPIQGFKGLLTALYT